MMQFVPQVVLVPVAAQAATASVKSLVQKKSGPINTLGVIPGGFGMLLHLASELPGHAQFQKAALVFR